MFERRKYFFKVKKYIFIYFQREGKGRREGEKHQCVVASHAPPTGGLAGNPGMCPDWELNRQHFSLQACTQFTDPRQPGLKLNFLKIQYKIFASSNSLSFLDNGMHTGCPILRRSLWLQISFEGSALSPIPLASSCNKFVLPVMKLGTQTKATTNFSYKNKNN